MTQEQLRQIIETRFTTQWVDPNVAFENVPFDPPDEKHWVRLSVQFLANAYNGLGECREIIGMVGVQIYSPARTGTIKQEQWSDLIVPIFTGSHDGISYYDAITTTVGDNTDQTRRGSEGWYQCNILINFTARG